MLRGNKLRANRLRVLLLGVVSLWIFVACGSYEARYYCYFYETQKSSSFDSIAVVIKSPDGRKVDLGYHDHFYKTYDEGDYILTVYRDSRKSLDYEFFKLDLSNQKDLPNGQAVLYSGYGLHRTPEGFEKSYQVPFTKKNLQNINRNPELIKYLPPKTQEDQVSIAFIKHQYNCHPLSYWGYIRKSIGLFFIAILSAG